MSTSSSSTHLPVSQERLTNWANVQDQVLTVCQLNSQYAPPPPYPYPNSQNSAQQEHCSSSCLWSESSSLQSNSQPGTAKHRSSWSNLLDMAEGNYQPNRPISSTPQNGLPQYTHFFATKPNPEPSNWQRTKREQQIQPIPKSFTYFHYSKPVQAHPLEATSSGQRQTPPSHSQSITPSVRQKKDRMQELRELWARPGYKLCCLVLLLLVIGLAIGAIFLAQSFSLPQHLEFAWFAPEQFRGGQPVANQGRLDVGQLGEQVKIELSGAMPFKSNFVSILDFKTNQIAIVDMSLRSNGRNLVCFVTELDRQNIPDMNSLFRAAKTGTDRRNQLHGWDERWTWQPNPLSQSPIFKPEIQECRDARWVQLSRTRTDQKGNKCSECFDFCLPEWGIDHDAIRDEKYLNVVHRMCFYLFVPEWRNYAQGYSPQQNQHDFELFYRQQQNQPTNQPNQQQSSSGLETKWISLQTPPQKPSITNNLTLHPAGHIVEPNSALMTLNHQLFQTELTGQQQQAQQPSLSLVQPVWALGEENVQSQQQKPQNPIMQNIEQKPTGMGIMRTNSNSAQTTREFNSQNPEQIWLGRR